MIGRTNLTPGRRACKQTLVFLLAACILPVGFAFAQGADLPTKPQPEREAQLQRMILQLQQEAQQLRREINQLKEERARSDQPERKGRATTAGDLATTRISVATPQDRETSVKSTPRIARASLNLTTDSLTPEQVKQALQMAVRFFHSQVARNGGYLWQYSGDLALREAEGKVYDSRIWVQPPGTPTIGEAFLDAYEATGEQLHLDAALDAANALLKGQFWSGGWDYWVTFDPDDPQPRRTNLDDDTTQAGLRFLMRLDKVLRFANARIHDAVQKGLDSLVRAQYPNGAWFVFITQLTKSFDPAQYPVVKASYPETWPRSPKGYVGERPRICYIINDNLVTNVVKTFLDAWDIYRDERYLTAAKKGGDFLLLAQMPEPQPAWIQQYDVKMQPTWGRAFEPPAITGLESQAVLESLLMLYRRTGDKKYLESVAPAIAYLKKSLLPDGNIARFYELQTNRPLFFTRNYELTYSSDDVPTHYGFVFESRLDAIEAEYRRLAAADPATLNVVEKPDRRKLAGRAVALLKWMDDRGAWVEDGSLRFHKVAPPSGMIKCQTFADNVRALCDFLTVQ
jgi:cell division protein FtsB